MEIDMDNFKDRIKEQIVERINEARIAAMSDLFTDIERKEFMEMFAEDMCEHCGSRHLPCYCWNDE